MSASLSNRKIIIAIVVSAKVEEPEAEMAEHAARMTVVASAPPMRA